MKKGSSSLDRILNALSHPVRRRILRALVDRRASASVLSREFEMDLGVVSYHLNQVLASECDVVELVDSVPRRGAVEKFYRLRSDAWADLSPASVSQASAAGDMRMLSPGECLLEAVEAMDGRTFDLLEGSAWEWFPVAVDTKAWEEIGEARKEFNQAVAAAVGESHKRDSRRSDMTEKHRVVVGAAAFPTAHAITGS